jgi:hypothetical protein
MKKIKITYRIDNPQGRALDALFHKIKGKRPAEAAMQEEVIRALVLNKDWTRFKGKQGRGGEEFSVLVEYIRQRAAANDRNFFKNLGRQLYANRPYKNDEIEDFLFKNWDATRGSAGEGLGLKWFIDEAVVELLGIVFGDRAPVLSAYRKIRKTAFLMPERPPKIKRVRNGQDGITLYPFK